MSGTLFVVGTPIGNVADVSERARETLAAVDVVAAEDTRHTGRLLQRLGVRARLLSFFEANERERVPQVIAMLREGSNVALVSDAGMPIVSDPGYRLVAACVREGIAVDVVPGPSAAVAALVISGLPADRWAFEGFLPRAGRARETRLAGLATDPRTLVLFESPKRLAKTVGEMLEAFGDRRAVIARELTKLHQEVMRGRLSELVKELDDRQLKGEVVVVIEGASVDGTTNDAGAATRIARALVAAGAKKRDAAREAASQTGVPAAEIYGALVRG